MKSIPTIYEGVQYRSRLEARWAAFFDQIGWRHSYEPFDVDGYIPDFLIHGTQPVLVEIKPYATQAEYWAELNRIATVLRGHWHHHILVVGASPLGYDIFLKGTDIEHPVFDPGDEGIYFDLTYRRGINQPSWLRDLMAVQLGNDNTGECRSRLVSHSRDVGEHGAYREMRDLGRVDGSGGYAVPPIWLMSQYIELARPGRAFANLCQRQPLPGGTDSINVPKILTGTTVDVQTADNQPVSDTDLTDTFINSPVRTLAGQQGVAIQLIDQSPIAFDDLIFRDLTAAHATVTDLQVLSGSGTNGQVLGLLNTPNITMLPVSSVDIKGFWSGLANAIQTVHTTRYLPPEVIVMHPRRWGWFESLLDLNQRPLVVPNANGPFNAAALLTDVASQQVVGQTHGLPIVTDPNIPTNLGSGNNEDIVIVSRVSDLVLWEGGIRARVLPETKAANLTVILQVFSYLAFTAGRYPQSTCVLTGLTAPSW